MPPRIVSNMTNKEKEKYFYWLDENGAVRLIAGFDLSRGDDFCAFTFLFPIGDGSFGVKTLIFPKNGEMEGEYFKL